MKLSKSLLVASVASLALGVGGAHAGWTIVGPTQVTVTPGETGSSTYIFTPPGSPPPTGIITGQSSSYQVEGSGIDLPIGVGSPFLNYLPATSPVGMGLTAGSEFSITVDWTISSNPLYIGDEFSANYSIDTDAYGSAGAAEDFIIQAVPAPEPAQTVAGAVLLGGGCVAFAGRRWLKRKNAQA